MVASKIEKGIDVEVPVHVAYNQWTQFEEFPRFMKNVKEVKQLDEKKLHWRVQIGGKEKAWDAVITEQLPDERVAWKAIGGTENAGVVTFHRISDQKSRVMLQLDYDTEGFAEGAADAVGMVTRSVESDLKNFKEFIESRGHETGAWRGEISQAKK